MANYVLLLLGAQVKAALGGPQWQGLREVDAEVMLEEMHNKIQG